MKRLGPNSERLRRCKAGLGIALLSSQGGAFAAPPPKDAPSREHPRPARTRASSAAPIPLLVFVYTSQVQLGGLAAVNAPALGLAAEFPRWAGAVTSLAARWRGGFEHNANFQN